MGILGDFNKGFIIVTVAIWIFVIIEFIAMGQIGIALLFLFVLMIPLSMIVSEYLRNRKKRETLVND